MTLLKPLQILFISLFLALSSNVWAMDLSSAMSKLSTVKSQGLVGEQTDGYLGVVKKQNDVQKITQLINQARKEQYQKMAQNHKVSLQEIEALAGKKAIEKTAPGLYIKIDGKWLKKR